MSAQAPSCAAAHFLPHTELGFLIGQETGLVDYPSQGACCPWAAVLLVPAMST